MASIRRRSVSSTEVVEDRPVAAAVDRSSVVVSTRRRMDPTPVIVAVVVAALVLFLIVFGLSRSHPSTGRSGSKTVHITVPSADK